MSRGLRGFKLSERIEERPKLILPRDGGRADFIKPVPFIDFSRVDEDVILNNQFVRLNTIYKIVDADGNLVDFSIKPEQYDFFKNKHNRNIILKSRQIGFTTLIQLWMLDEVLFNPNKSAGIIAHNKEDAEKFFDKKLKLAYDNIPADFKRKHCPTAMQDAANQLKFSNGSYLSVGTSMRSDTLQYLHVSEYGKLCAKFPEKAAEVQSGALNAISKSSFVVIESTAEGAHGHFYDLCHIARRMADRGQELSSMDYKFFFYPWWLDKKYTLGLYQEPTEELANYFSDLRRQSGIALTRAQKNWYIVKEREQQEKMWREYPSTPDEAFRGIIEGAPLGRVMAQLRRNGHITRVPWQRFIPVDTFWDLGRNDKTAIWFMQAVGHERRFIDYLEDSHRPLSDYAAILNRKPYNYGTHHLPHDAEVVELTQTDALSRREVLEGLLPGEFYVVPKITSEEDGVNATRENMDNCWFDEERTEDGVKCLEQVRYKFDERLQNFVHNLQRNQWKHGYDAFAQYGHGYRHRGSSDRFSGEAQNEWARANRAQASTATTRSSRRHSRQQQDKQSRSSYF